MLRVLLILWILPVCSKLSFAQTDDDEDLPFEQYIQEFLFIESSYAQEKKEWQFTLDIPYCHQDRQLGVTVLSEYGLTDRLQVEAAFTIDDFGESGSQLETGLLYNFLSTPKTSLSVGSSMEFSIEEGQSDSDDQMEDDAVELESAFFFSQDFQYLQFHATLGVEWEDMLFYEAGLIFPLGDFKPILEVTGPLSDTDSDHVFGAGLIWNGSEFFEFAFGSPISISDSHLQWGLIGKMTVEF